MTINETRALMEKCLIEYEPTLKTVGAIRTYAVSGSAPIMVKESVDRSLEAMDENEIQFAITNAVERLRCATKNGFLMSQPDPVLKSLHNVQTVTHGDLSLSFVPMYDADRLEPITHFAFWFYPI
jgi:hypothetical protein